MGASGAAVTAAGFFQSRWIKPVVKVGVLPVHAQLSEEPPLEPGSVTFNTPGTTTWVVPDEVTSIRITASGARGGSVGGWNNGGYGGRVVADVPVIAGEMLSITVGEMGYDPQNYHSIGADGGIGGGGSGGNGSTIATGGAGGGGASWVWRKASTYLVVAGGGGGGGNSGSEVPGGFGGSNTGGNGGGSPGGGGGQTGGIGGTAGDDGMSGTNTTGGTGASSTSTGLGGGGGGGGGGYGGGGGGSSGILGVRESGGGGGGASYVILGATVKVNEQGVNSGDGQVIFAWG